MTPFHDLISQGLRRRFVRMPAAPRPAWNAQAHTRMYNTLLRGHSPGMIWLWKEDEHAQEQVLDGWRRLEAMMRLVGHTVYGVPIKNPAQRVTFDTKSNRFVVSGLLPTATDPRNPGLPGPMDRVDTGSLLLMSEPHAERFIEDYVQCAGPASLQAGRTLRTLRRVLDVNVFTTVAQGDPTWARDLRSAIHSRTTGTR